MAKNNPLNDMFAEELSAEELAAFEGQGYESKAEIPILTLAIGQSVRGIYLEKGEYEVFDKQEKKNKMLPTYTIETEKGLIRLGGKMTLDRAMAQIADGTLVIVTRKPPIDTQSGNSLPVYHVLAKRVK